MKILFIFIAILLAILLSFYLFLQYGAKGVVGEFIVKLTYKIYLSKKKYKLYNNLIFNFEDSSVQIDHLIVSQYGVFVIETKNYSGKIYGSESAEQFTQFIGKKKNEFYSPIKQNKGHIYKLKSIIGKYPYTSVIVFMGGITLKVNSETFVGAPLNSVRYIKSFKQKILTNEQVIELCNKIEEALKNYNVTLKQHIENVHERQEEYNEAINSGVCPLCGSPIALRHGKYGDFYGCSSYPKCKFKKNIE